MVKRCSWAASDPLMVSYHDQEWGVPLHDDRRLFEMLVLEGCQAGLSWLTILKKRAHYRRVFDRFRPERVAAYEQNKVQQLLADPGIVRNRLKIESAIHNAKLFLQIKKDFGSFDVFIWDFVGQRPIRNRWKSQEEVPAMTPLSDSISKQLKKRGFKFVGSTICYAFMQSVGLVNDHVTTCFRHRQLASKPKDE